MRTHRDDSDRFAHAWDEFPAPERFRAFTLCMTRTLLRPKRIGALPLMWRWEPMKLGLHAGFGIVNLYIIIIEYIERIKRHVYTIGPWRFTCAWRILSHHKRSQNWNPVVSKKPRRFAVAKTAWSSFLMEVVLFLRKKFSRHSAMSTNSYTLMSTFTPRPVFFFSTQKTLD